ncbi:hypothetical protein EIP86_009058 [Pleurotus ostreatoroseus]|nr:hypothetical protein EIP86_009058 [Pleurotus ostreatoroseus]
MSEVFFKGPISTRKRKAELQTIAEALGLDSTGTVILLVTRIKNYVKENNDRLSLDPRFQGLTTDAGYRPGASGTTKATGKTSADKADEDQHESEKAVLPPTGANKKLLESAVTTDPPASFEPLKTDVVPTMTAASNASLDNMEIDDKSSSPAKTPEHTPSGFEDDDADTNSLSGANEMMAELQTPTRGKSIPRSVIVRMRDWFDRNATPEDIYLREGDEGVKLEDRDVHGSTVPHVCLDQLLPVAINQNTPIKVASGESRVSLGSVQSILSGNSKQLHIDKVRLMPLLPTKDDDTFICDIFLEDEEGIPSVKAQKVKALFAQSTCHSQKPLGLDLSRQRLKALSLLAKVTLHLLAQGAISGIDDPSTICCSKINYIVVAIVNLLLALAVQVVLEGGLYAQDMHCDGQDKQNGQASEAGKQGQMQQVWAEPNATVDWEMQLHRGHPMSCLRGSEGSERVQRRLFATRSG